MHKVIEKYINKSVAINSNLNLLFTIIKEMCAIFEVMSYVISYKNYTTKGNLKMKTKCCSQ